MVDSPCTLPSPKQVVHGSLIMRPSPSQLGHVEILTNWPNMERDTCRISPAPLHWGHVVLLDPLRAPVPLQTSQRFCFRTFIFFSTPVAISSSERVSLTRRSDPGEPSCRGPRRRLRWF